MGLLYIASYIRKFSNHNVSILDLQAKPLEDGVLIKRIREIGPDVVGVTTWTDFWYPVWRLIGLIKRNLPEVHITLGGPHVSIYPELTLSHTVVDSIILGDGEIPMLKLLDHLEFGAPFSIDGLYLRKDPPSKGFKSYVLEDLNSIPHPERKLLPLDDYTSVLAKDSRITTMITSRGCPYRCVFCKLSFQEPKFRSALNVLDEMEQIQGFGIKELEIYDDTFTWSKKRLVEICQGVVERDIRLRWAIRDRVNNVSEESLHWLRRAGCNRIHLGVESGNPNILKHIKKNIDLQQAKQAVDLAKKAGFTVLTYYMIGLPGEREKEVMETIEFALSLDSDYVEFNICIPYPGTEMYEEALRKGIIPKDYWKEFAINPVSDFILPYVYEEYLTKVRLIELRNLAVRKYYLRSKLLLRELRRCSSLSEFRRKARMGLTILRQSYTR
ncbi:MAG: radical SAM protein [Thermodesulfobacteriota bacterium]